MRVGDLADERQADAVAASSRRGVLVVTVGKAGEELFRRGGVEAHTVVLHVDDDGAPTPTDSNRDGAPGVLVGQCVVDKCGDGPS